jgi:beta-glucosidase
LTSTVSAVERQGRIEYPVGFRWGVATAAYQTEGAVSEDGRGKSIWDTFSHAPGRTRGGDNGDIACDSYHRLEEDLALLSELGVGAYRFSIAWPRVQPEGRGPANSSGLDYYSRLVNGLLERGIEPFVTLYHWDLPQALEDAGGWPARDTANRFADYVGIVAEALGDRVSRWVTINEPWVVVNAGYRSGRHAPGCADSDKARATTHHVLLGHGLATQVLRATAAVRPEVGISLNLVTFRAADEDAVDLAAELDAEHNGIYLESVLHGRYPTHLSAEYLPAAETISQGDLDVISTPVDLLGVNYYMSHLVRRRSRAGLRPEEIPAEGHPQAVFVTPSGAEVTAMGWVVDPEGMYGMLKRVGVEAPGLPIYITENGAAYPDYVNPDGVVNDFERVRYIESHLAAARRAISEGVNLRGYFVWSLLDNFEWAEGFSKRFGLVFVDYGSQRRIPKASAGWYAEVASTNSIPPPPG